jgi:4-oxalocrotonate tautomerase
MPHVIVKLWPGKTEEQKAALSQAIADGVMRILGSKETSVSVAFEEVDSQDWTAKVFEPDILGKWGNLTKQPGYGPRPE